MTEPKATLLCCGPAIARDTRTQAAWRGGSCSLRVPGSFASWHTIYALNLLRLLTSIQCTTLSTARPSIRSLLRRRETHCEFCDSILPDWKSTLTPVCGANAPAVMNVNFDGQTYSFEVKPGPAGYKQFTQAIREAFSLPEDSELNITFTCDEPSQGMCVSKFLSWHTHLLLVEALGLKLQHFILELVTLLHDHSASLARRVLTW